MTMTREEIIKQAIRETYGVAGDTISSCVGQAISRALDLALSHAGPSEFDQKARKLLSNIDPFLSKDGYCPVCRADIGERHKDGCKMGLLQKQIGELKEYMYLSKTLPTTPAAEDSPPLASSRATLPAFAQSWCEAHGWIHYESGKCPKCHHAPEATPTQPAPPFFDKNGHPVTVGTMMENPRYACRGFVQEDGMVKFPMHGVEKVWDCTMVKPKQTTPPAPVEEKGAYVVIAHGLPMYDNRCRAESRARECLHPPFNLWYVAKIVTVIDQPNVKYRPVEGMTPEQIRVQIGGAK